MGSRRALCRAVRDSRREQVGWVGDNWSQVQFEEGEKISETVSGRGSRSVCNVCRKFEVRWPGRGDRSN